MFTLGVCTEYLQPGTSILANTALEFTCLGIICCLCSVQSDLGEVISLEAINQLLMPGMNMKRRNDGR